MNTKSIKVLFCVISRWWVVSGRKPVWECCAIFGGEKHCHANFEVFWYNITFTRYFTVLGYSMYLYIFIRGQEQYPLVQ